MTPAADANRSAPLPRAVFWVGLVSLVTDASSDLIYPLLPLFLTSVLHASASYLGGVEGAAEATASLLKWISGRLTDRTRRRKPLTVLGYGLSSLSRPLIGLATAAWMVLGVRVADRIGKGLRSSPRDALLADVTPPAQRGRAYGFHRAMDNTGAVIGPALGALLLWKTHLSLRSIFLLAALPGGAALLMLLFGVREPDHSQTTTASEQSPALGREKAVGPTKMDRSLKFYFIGLALFSLGNASDVFLLLRAQTLGLGASLIPVLWMAHNLTRAALSTAGGALSDRVGRRRVIAGGWILYALAYLGFGFATRSAPLFLLFPFYGLYYALAEGTEKALVADLASEGSRGRAFGSYYAVVGLSALPASLGFGVLITHFGAPITFSVAAALALAGALVLLLGVAEPEDR